MTLIIYDNRIVGKSMLNIIVKMIKFVKLLHPCTANREIIYDLQEDALSCRDIARIKIYVAGQYKAYQ